MARAWVELPAALLDDLLEHLDDLEDRLSVHERDHLTVDFETLRAEL
jgi:hypothetical protein